MQIPSNVLTMLRRSDASVYERAKAEATRLDLSVTDLIIFLLCRELKETDGIVAAKALSIARAVDDAVDKAYAEHFTANNIHTDDPDGVRKTLRDEPLNWQKHFDASVFN